MGESYVGAIGTNAPRQAADLLRARMQSGQRANERLAEWVHDYTQLLSKHASELERFTAKHVIDESQLGTLAQPWQAVAQLVLEQARSGLDAARRAHIETEKSLRDARWPQVERTLDQLDSGAVAPAEAIDKLQQLDVERLATIKNALARFGTIEVDRAQSQTNASEHAAQAWLAYDPQDDVAAYVAQVVSGVAPVATKQSQQRHASAATQASTQSDSTVRRKSSLRFGGGGGGASSSAAHDEPRSNLRSKVGSLFGRKKKNSSAAKDGKLDTTREDTPDSSSVASRPRTTRPPDFGLRAPSPIRRESQASMRSGTSNASDLYSQPSPRRPASAAGGAGAGTGTGAGAGAGAGPGGAAAAAGPGAGSQPGPISPPPTSYGQSSSSPRTQKPTNLPPVSIPGQPGGMFAPLTPTKVTSPRGSPGGSPQGSYGSPVVNRSSPTVNGPVYASSGSAPAPPPARQSTLNRTPSFGRTPSNASYSAVQRSASLQRTPSQRERVNSQLFANMTPAETGGSGTGHMAPIPGTPQNGPIPGTPQEQFWTPAARFPQQFGQFDANGSMASLTLRPAEMPPVPAEQGLVAAAVERISATFVGEELASSSVHGEAVAQISGGNNNTVALGVLLADPHAQLTPSSNLVQTSSLSFEVPASVYGGTTQDLVTYECGTALGRVPVKVTPLWRVEATMVRLVLSYQLSDLYIGSDSVTVQNLVIAVSVGGRGKASSAQSKPVATFSREKQRVTWRFNEPVTLRRGQPPQKLLAQFVVEGNEPVEPGPIDIRFKLPQLANPVLQLRTLTPNGEWVPVPTTIAGSVTADVQSRSAAGQH